MIYLHFTNSRPRSLHARDRLIYNLVRQQQLIENGQRAILWLIAYPFQRHDLCDRAVLKAWLDGGCGFEAC